MSNIEKFQFQNVPSAADGGLIIDAEVRAGRPTPASEFIPMYREEFDL